MCVGKCLAYHVCIMCVSCVYHVCLPAMRQASVSEPVDPTASFCVRTCVYVCVRVRGACVCECVCMSSIPSVRPLSKKLRVLVCV